MLLPMGTSELSFGIFPNTAYCLKILPLPVLYIWTNVSFNVIGTGVMT